MPRINLVYLRTAPQSLGTELVYYERIKALLEINNLKTWRRACLVDPGCVLSVFPQRQWEPFEKEITWLDSPGGRDDLPPWLAEVTGLGAQSIKCRIGKVKLQIIEMPLSLLPRYSPEVEIIAKFPYDDGAYPQILLGLGGGAFLQWNLVVNSAKSQAWLDY